MTVKFFGNASEFRSWLARHGTTASELWVGFYKKESGKGGISYGEAEIAGRAMSHV